MRRNTGVDYKPMAATRATSAREHFQDVEVTAKEFATCLGKATWAKAVGEELILR
jgi:hypothetical protein